MSRQEMARLGGLAKARNVRARLSDALAALSENDQDRLVIACRVVFRLGYASGYYAGRRHAKRKFTKHGVCALK